MCHPLGDLVVTYTVHLWLVGKRVVNFLLALIKRFSLALTVEALWANIGRNCAVWKGVGHFERKFQGEGGHPPTTFGVRKLDSLGYHVVLFAWSYKRFDTIPARNTQTDRHTHTRARSWLLPAQRYLRAGKNSRFEPFLRGLRGNAHGSSMACGKARGRLAISANWTFFASCHGSGAMSRYWSKFWFLKGGGLL